MISYGKRYGFKMTVQVCSLLSADVHDVQMVRGPDVIASVSGMFSSLLPTDNKSDMRVCTEAWHLKRRKFSNL